MDQTQPIRAKVAQVLSDNELVINVGKADGVTYDMEFNITEMIEITDPDTSKVLGVVEWPIVFLDILKVQENLTVLYSTDKTLITDDKRIFSKSLLSSSRAFVNVGDPVVQVLEVDESKQENTNEK